MAQIALPRQQDTQTQSAGIGSPLYQRRQASNAGPIELVPNPEFTFPMRGPDTASSEPSYSTNAPPMSLQAYPTGRRGSAPGLRQKSVSTLPDFSFNPAVATLAPPATTPPVTTTPPHSPSLATPTTPSRPIGGHRRGGSEFIGGDGRSGGMSLMSTSPTKGDGILPPPAATLRPGPLPGRRGHAHRRSGAISSHDLSSIMQPNVQRADSAPVTPLEGNQFVFGHSVNKSMSQPSLRDAGNFSDDLESSPRRPPSRARVGFADKVEYIRPLSTISSETETSMSTVRGHSATGSLSSIISATSSPQPSRTGRTMLSPAKESEGRPHTAGAILDQQQSPPFASDLFSRKRPMSALSPISPTITGPGSLNIPVKRRGFFRSEPKRCDNSMPGLPTSVSDPALSSLDSPITSSSIVEDEEVLAESDKLKSSSRKASLKPRKVKSWANSIIPRKAKHSKKSKSKAPTPIAELVQDSDDTDDSDDQDFEANFDVDNTVVIVSPTEDSAPTPKINTDIASWRPRELKRVNSDTMSPAIDLDAALGPFNTPDGSAPRSQQRGFGAHRRAMHSAGGVSQTHRRTESAPELIPFEFRPSTVAATSTMADVFEEDEPEDDGLASNKSPASTVESSVEEVEEPKIQVVEAEGSHHDSRMNWNFDDGLRLRRGDNNGRKQESAEPLSPLEVPKPVPSGNSSKQSLNVSPVEVVEDYEEPRTSSLTHSSDSTVTAQIPSSQSKESEAIMKVAVPLPQQSLMTPDTFTSSFSSPDFRSSQTSFDTPRLGTASSSLTDYRAMPSPRFGEPGPELRVSVDDVPSLTSSRSTMTSAMHPSFPLASPRRPSDRSASLCSAPSELDQRRRKRSSIASLSRLINSSSYGEKSKLSIEQRPQSAHMEPAKESKKKHKRLSKLMQFWKPKDPARN